MFRQRSVSTTRKDLRAMLGDGIFFSIMVGIGETYLPAFVLAVGLGEVASGLITSLPLLAGAILQLLSPRAVRHMGSYRRWIVLCATIQAASFLPLCLAAWAGRISTPVVFLIAAAYWGFGMSTGPAWNTWAEMIVPKQLRPTYFARRTKFTQLGTFLGFVSGGCILQYARSHDLPGGLNLQLAAFSLLFVTAGLCRFLSARCLASQSEPTPIAADHRHVGAWELLRRFQRGGSERLLVYLVAVQFTVYIAAPYFNPYMLGQLKFNYGTYVFLIATSFIAKMVSLPALGVIAHRWGAQRLLWIGGIGIVPLSGMWWVSNSVPFLFALQFAGGIVWAAYELAMLLLFFETIRREERTSVLTLYNVANALAMVLGSLCSGLVLKLLGEQRETYLLIFVLSSAARLVTLVFLAQLPNMRFQALPMSVRTLAVSATEGSLDRPVLPSIPEEPGQGSPELCPIPVEAGALPRRSITNLSK
jgi:MFS family permease